MMFSGVKGPNAELFLCIPAPGHCGVRMFSEDILWCRKKKMHLLSYQEETERQECFEHLKS